ncbi:MAG: polysaccharide biosynthesis C-terminal domain-containing protein, partial [Thermodesulfobacteriota bacterium]
TGTYRLGLIAHGRQKILLAITVSGAGLNVGLNALLIPRFSITGAALSALASEAFIFILVALALSRSVSLPPWGPVFAPALATSGMALILWLLPAKHLAVTLAVGATTYALLALVVRAVRPNEVLGALQGWPRSAASDEHS